MEARLDHRAGLRHERSEREIFQLVAHVLHAHAAGERRINVERLLGNAFALVGWHKMQRAHIVQPVGELDDEDAHVIGNGQQQLAEIFSLFGTLGNEIEFL